MKLQAAFFSEQGPTAAELPRQNFGNFDGVASWEVPMKVPVEPSDCYNAPLPPSRFFDQQMQQQQNQERMQQLGQQEQQRLGQMGMLRAPPGLELPAPKSEPPAASQKAADTPGRRLLELLQSPGGAPLEWRALCPHTEAAAHSGSLSSHSRGSGDSHGCSSGEIVHRAPAKLPKHYSNVSTVCTEPGTPQADWYPPGNFGSESGSEQGQKQAADDKEYDGPKTTVMIRNIACRYTKEQTQTFLDEAGLKDKYSFIHLPLNPSRRANLGYVFVTFKAVEGVEECHRLLTGRPLGTSLTEKRCEVSLAHVQGPDCLLEMAKPRGKPARRTA